MRTQSLKDFPLDLKLVIVYLFLTVLFLTVPPLDETAIRAILGIPMVLFVPGYVLIAALFPGRNDLEDIERVALSFGLSIATVPLLGLGLNFTPWGIRPAPVTSILVFYSLLLLIIANFRRFALPPEERFYFSLKALLAEMREEFAEPRTGSDRILTIMLVLSILISLATLVYVIQTPKQGERFTEFYILGASGKASDYPREISPGEQVELIVGIVNHEYSDINYTLRVQIKNMTFLERKVRLSHNETWEKPVSLIINITGSNMKLGFLLFREDMEAPYRDAHLWVNSTMKNGSVNLTAGKNP